MKKLTLDEAAKELGVKKESVYKRVQRGTLPSTKGRDGRVYVYMDDTKSIKGDANIATSDGGNQNEQRSWWDYAVEVSGLVVLFGALIYALGLVVLLIPIARVHTQDLSTAWHATFLVPRAVVAGLGMRQLVAYPLFAAILVFATAIYSRRLGGERATRYFMFVLIYFYSVWRILTGPSPLSQSPYIINVLVFHILLAGFILLLAWSIYMLVNRRYRSAIPTAIFILVCVSVDYLIWSRRLAPSVEALENPGVAIATVIDAAIIVTAGMVVWLGGVLAAAKLGPLDPADRIWRKLLQQFLVVLSAAIFAAFMLTIPSKPPLPMVEIDVKDKDKNIVGRLLTHTDSFWYVFEGQEDQPGRRLTAIPDNEVKTAWVSKVTQ
jgi:excisionase family DNA binding protein